MPQTLNLKIKGLITNPNNLTENVMDGAFSVADNIVISKDNVAESRRGFGKYNDYLELGSIDGFINQVYSYKDTLIAHHNNLLSRDNGDGTWTQYTGTFESASDYRMKAIEENQNLYVTTDTGIKKLDAVDSEFYLAGVVPALDGYGSVTGTGWFEDDRAVAYRMVLVREDANENLVIGAPSSRVIVKNESGAGTDVGLTFSLPGGLSTDYRYQIYRSPQTETADDEPTDELQLVLDGNIKTADITAGEIEVYDDVADALKGTFLYTSPSQEGIINSNYEPPLCKDITVFKNHTFYANSARKHSFEIKLLGTGTDGLSIGDTITIGSNTFTAAASESIVDAEFELVNTGTVSLDIQDTALSLVNVINKYAGNDEVYAYYASGYDDLPGKIRLEERTLGGDTFYVTSSNGNVWSPQLESSGTDNPSTNDAAVNRVFISKDGQPEAVPLLNYLDVGSANKEIKRIIGLRESIFVFKEDAIYKITGESIANFRVTLHDNTTAILGADSAVTFNNTVFCMSLQGVISVSEAGVQVVSRNIEQELLELIQMPAFETTTFGVSYESERSYILFCVNSQSHSYPHQAYVYNSFTNAWTRWTYEATCGLVLPSNDKLYLGGKELGFSQHWIFQERKTFTVADFVDTDFPTEISAMNYTDSTYLRLTVPNLDNAVVGYWVSQVDAGDGSQALGYITDTEIGVNPSAYYIYITRTSTRMFDTNPSNNVTIYKPITCRAKYVMNTAGNPAVLKQFREATLFFRNDTNAALDVGYETSLRPGYESTESRTYDIGVWGQDNWGSIPWGGVNDTYFQPVRVGIPRNKQKCIGISFSVECANAFSPFALNGISSTFEAISERIPYRGRRAGNG